MSLRLQLTLHLWNHSRELLVNTHTHTHTYTQLQGDEKTWQPILNPQWTNEQQVGYDCKSNHWIFFFLITWEIALGVQGHKDKITEEKNVKNRTKWSNIQIIIFPNEERKEQTKVDTVMDELIKENFSPDSSVGKESACNSGDPSLIPGSGRSTGEGIGYPLTHSSILGLLLWLSW